MLDSVASHRARCPIRRVGDSSAVGDWAATWGDARSAKIRGRGAVIIDCLQTAATTGQSYGQRAALRVSRVDVGSWLWVSKPGKVDIILQCENLDGPAGSGRLLGRDTTLPVRPCSPALHPWRSAQRTTLRNQQVSSYRESPPCSSLHMRICTEHEPQTPFLSGLPSIKSNLCAADGTQMAGHGMGQRRRCGGTASSGQWSSQRRQAG